MVKDAKGSVLMIGRKLLWHIHIVGFAIAFVDCFLESKKYKKINKTMDLKVSIAKEEINDSIFEMRLTDLKTKFLSIKNVFRLVMEGDDAFEVRRSRLDSIFLICEEVHLLISDPQSELLKHAECCLDLICAFTITHLGMIRIGQEMFKLSDYDRKLQYLIEFYPVLMRSYTEKAIENYIRPIILNYHNQYSKMDEIEEIFYEKTGQVLYKIKSNDWHAIWPCSREEMVKDRMFYEFDERKLRFVDPPIIGMIETPIIVRALRYGVSLKLEDLYQPYSQAVDMIAKTLQSSQKEEEMKCSFATVNPHTDDYEHVQETDFHYQRTVHVEKAKAKANDIKRAAKEDFKKLKDICVDMKELSEEAEKDKSSLMKKLVGGETAFKMKFTEALMSGELGSFEALNQFMCFSAENSRFFATLF